MIAFANLKEMDSKPLIQGDLLYDLFKKGFNISSEDFASVLHRPHHMVVDIADASAVMNKIILHTYSIS